MKKICIAAIFPPGARLSNEGLGRYLEVIVRSSSGWIESNKNYEVILAVASWNRAWGKQATSGTGITLKTYLPRTWAGAVLYVWSYKDFRSKLETTQIRIPIINRSELAWTIHKWSAGIFPEGKPNFLGILFRELLTFSAKSILYIIKMRKSSSSINQILENVSSDPARTRNFPIKLIFDYLFKIEASSLVKRISRGAEFVYLGHNRLSPKGLRANSAMLVPDLIPIELAERFNEDSKRWENLQRDILVNSAEMNCLITFSNHTVTYARETGILGDDHRVSIIPHASRPPSKVWEEYFDQKERGIGNAWVDYWWRSGSQKISNSIYRMPSFNNRLVYCIYPTQFRPHKGILELIESWNDVLEYFPTVKLVLTADPWKNNDLLDAVVSRGLEMSVIFVPNLSEAELIAWTIRSKLVISASEAEGAMPFMVSEAMAAQTPFLIRDLDVSKEVIPSDIQDICFFKKGHLTQSIVRTLENRDEILKAQMNWSGEYVRTWDTVWAEWMALSTRRFND